MRRPNAASVFTRTQRTKGLNSFVCTSTIVAALQQMLQTPADTSESGNEIDLRQQNLDAGQSLRDIEHDDEEDAEPPWKEPKLHSARCYALRTEQALLQVPPSALYVLALVSQ